MKKKTIIVLIILAVILFGFYISKGSRFQKTNIFENKPNEASDNSKNISTDDSTNQGGNENDNAIAPNIEVKPADCDKDCSRFKKDNEKEYCQEICGTTSYFEDAEEEGGSSDDCNDEKGVQKDYCLKDIAVGNNDFKACEEISDKNIKKSCQNRITEDILEKQNPLETSKD